jgi:signal peptidase I
MIRQAKPSAAEAPAARSAPASHPPHDGLRETVESVVVAFVLAFLFRTFEAEAFVIPTGSMAPTLSGRHKDVACEKCAFPYRVSAKPEVDDEGRRFRDVWMTASMCPNCGYAMELGTRMKEGPHPSYNGDRILVAKFPYQIGEPKRWDVVVFKYPVHSHQNFIKRLVGLPEEQVQILRGDIYVKGPQDADFKMARKPPLKVQAMMQTVYDNDYVDPEIIQRGWPARWNSWAVPVDEAAVRGFPESSPQLTTGKEGWVATEDQRSFRIEGDHPEPVWLRYTHTVPTPQDWQRLIDKLPVEPQYMQILDFNAYNMGLTNFGGGPGLVRYWVGDLAVDCEVEVGSPTGQLVLELVEGGVRFQCHIDVATGEARMSHTADPAFQPQPQPTRVKGPGVYRLAFANVDDQLLLWVDGECIAFDAAYEPLGNNAKPLAADYAPVGIASAGAKARVSHLRVLRDIYYIAARFNMQSNNPEGETFPLDKDQFFVLGDNSAESLDARYWGETRFVHRDLMIGKALLVYWPHGWYEIPGTGIPFYIPGFDVPLYPNFARMGYVR